jgi:hypothetical protein
MPPPMIATRVIEQPSSRRLVVLTSIVTDHLAPCIIALLFLAFRPAEGAAADPGDSRVDVIAAAAYDSADYFPRFPGQVFRVSRDLRY